MKFQFQILCVINYYYNELQLQNVEIKMKPPEIIINNLT